VIINIYSISFQETTAREQLIHAEVSRVVKTGLVSASRTVLTSARVVPAATRRLLMN